MSAAPHSALSATSRAVLRSLVPVICPPEAMWLAEPIVDHMALTLGALPAVVRRGFAVALAAYDLGAVARYGRRARALTGARAEAYFGGWERGITPRAQLAKAINQLMSLACYEQPAMMESVGYRPGPWIDEVSRRRLRTYGDDARAQAAATIAPDPLVPALAEHAAQVAAGGRDGRG